MPSYTFRNKKTKKVWEDMMSIADMEKMLAENPDVEQVFSKLRIGYRVGGIKNDNGWGNVLRRIKNSNRGSTIDTGNLGEL